MNYSIRDNCRLCQEGPLNTVLELAPTPPANEFIKPSDLAQDSIPLYLAECQHCGHVQLPVVVDPNRLFKNYVYVSGTSPSFVDHFRRYAESLCRYLQPGDLVVEVGSNDGTMLRFFQRAGMRVLGVDPAQDIAARATADGIPTLPEFFTEELAAKIRLEHGEAKLVVANNVFAHADDLAGIARGVRSLITPSGLFVFEVQYLLDLVQKSLFDLIYHEHLSCHSIAPLQRFFNGLGMHLRHVDRVPTHGGSIRCMVLPSQKHTASPQLHGLLADEREQLTFASFGALKQKIKDAKAWAKLAIAGEIAKGHRIIGYGAPAKMCTMAHEFGISAAEISCVIDDNQWKQGLLCPGTRIPVVTADHLAVDGPHSIFVFAWNFADQIIEKLHAGGYHGTVYVPFPEPREVVL